MDGDDGVGGGYGGVGDGDGVQLDDGDDGDDFPSLGGNFPGGNATLQRAFLSLFSPPRGGGGDGFCPTSDF